MEVNPNSASFPIINSDNQIQFTDTKADKASLRKIVQFLKSPGDHFSQMSIEDQKKLKDYLSGRVTELSAESPKHGKAIQFLKTGWQRLLTGKGSEGLARKGLKEINRLEEKAESVALTKEYNTLNDKLKTLQQTIAGHEKRFDQYKKTKDSLNEIPKPTKQATKAYTDMFEGRQKTLERNEAAYRSGIVGFNHAVKELESLAKEKGLSKFGFGDIKEAVDKELLKTMLIKIKMNESPKESGAFNLEAQKLLRDSDPQTILDVIPQFLEQISDKSVMDFKIDPNVLQSNFSVKEGDRKIDPKAPEKIHTYGDSEFSYSITSGYAWKTSQNGDIHRDGDPIADDIRLSKYLSNDGGAVYIMGVSDGSGHSIRAKDAAIDGNKGFEEYCLKAISKGIPTKKALAKVVLEGVYHAQNKIKPDFDNLADVKGLTTFSGAVIKSNKDGTATAVITTVGDLKYFVKRADGSVEEITKGNRQSADVRDAGGQLGEGVDLRNFGLYITDLNKGDVLLAMSDGVHDNLNPSTYESRTPEEVYNMLLESPFVDEESKVALRLITVPEEWAHTGEISEDLNTLQDIYMTHRIKELDNNGDSTTPLSEKLTKYSFDAGKNNRDYFVKHTKQSKDLPGKIDHISCAQVKI